MTVATLGGRHVVKSRGQYHVTVPSPDQRFEVYLADERLDSLLVTASRVMDGTLDIRYSPGVPRPYPVACGSRTTHAAVTP